MAGLVLEERRISETEYTDFEINTIAFSEIATATKAFLTENFGGAVRITTAFREGGFVDLSPEGFAYFFKLLLSAVFGRGVVDIDLYSDGKEFKVSAEWDKRHEITEDDVDKMFTAAKSSGFEMEFLPSEEKYCITLKLKENKVPFISVYAVDFNRITFAFKRIFFL